MIITTCARLRRSVQELCICCSAEGTADDRARVDTLALNSEFPVMTVSLVRGGRGVNGERGVPVARGAGGTFRATHGLAYAPIGQVARPACLEHGLVGGEQRVQS